MLFGTVGFSAGMEESRKWRKSIGKTEGTGMTAPIGLAFSAHLAHWASCRDSRQSLCKLVLTEI